MHAICPGPTKRTGVDLRPVAQPPSSAATTSNAVVIRCENASCSPLMGLRVQRCDLQSHGCGSTMMHWGGETSVESPQRWKPHQPRSVIRPSGAPAIIGRVVTVARKHGIGWQAPARQRQSLSPTQFHPHPGQYRNLHGSHGNGKHAADAAITFHQEARCID